MTNAPHKSGALKRSISLTSFTLSTLCAWLYFNKISYAQNLR